jgi:hypothetical protein
MLRSYGDVKLSGSRFLNFQEVEGEGQHDNPIQQPLFFAKKVWICVMFLDAYKPIFF